MGAARIRSEINPPTDANREKTFYYPQAVVLVGAVVENFGAQQRPVPFEATPISIDIVRNSYKQPDSWSVTFDWRDLPIPPALVRTASVAIYLYDNQDFIKNDKSLVIGNIPPAIVGIIDDIEISLGSEGKTLTLTGQDYTILFAETKIKRTRTITGTRLDRALRQFIEDVDPCQVLSLKVDLQIAPSSVQLSAAAGAFSGVDPNSINDAGTLLPIIGRHSTRTNRNGFPIKRGESYWDTMYRMAQKHGFLLYVDGFDIVLTTPQDLLKRADRTDRQKFFLTWGRNVSDVTMDRNMGKQRVPVIEVRAYDPATRSVLVEEFPKRGQLVATGIGTKREEKVTIPIYGVNDRKILARMAEGIYNLTARSEQTLQITTRELQDERFNNMLNIRNSDLVFLKFDPFNTEELQKLQEEQRVTWLIERGFTPRTASFFVDNFQKLDTFKKPFYVRSSTLTWDKDDGLSIDLEMVNFVTASGIQESGTLPGDEVSADA